jgi:hypothetical protein
MIDARPILLVDIDGVLNPLSGEHCPDGFSEYHLFPADDEPVRLAAVHGKWLRELSVGFDLVWASAWGLQAHKLLGPILDLPEFPFVPMPQIPFPPAEKIPAVAAFIGDRRAAWIDDCLGDSARRWAASRKAPTLLVPIDPATGLTRQAVDQLLAWADLDY